MFHFKTLLVLLFTLAVFVAQGQEVRGNGRRIIDDYYNNLETLTGIPPGPGAAIMTTEGLADQAEIRARAAKEKREQAERELAEARTNEERVEARKTDALAEKYKVQAEQAAAKLINEEPPPN